MTNTVTFHVGDVRDVMANMPDSSVDLIVTSPPFLALRSYLPADHPDKHREIGSEATPAVFLDTLLELSAEWRRLLTSTGSLCVEIGDTYSGSGGAGGDYGDGGLRDGQPKFRQVNSREHRAEREATTADGGARLVPVNGGPGWPLDKSLCLIPTLYTAALAYGINPLTGQPSPAGQWRVRNLLTWTRPNPPVGALGDKFRPATSFVTVACMARNRWFDLDAVRTAAQDTTPRHTNGPKSLVDRGDHLRVFDERIPSNPAGAPPLDWWGQDWQPLHRLPTAPYAGAHYAAYPIALPRRLIEAMCPREVCAVCGEPRRRIVHNNGSPYPFTYHPGQNGGTATGGMGGHVAVRDVTHIGWTDCGHDNYRPGVVCDPFGGSGTTAVAAALTGRDATLIDLDHRNVDLARQRLTETLHIVNEHHHDDTWTWTVRNDLPGLKHEHPDQRSLFAEEAV